MDEYSRSALRVCRPTFMKDLNVQFVLPELIANDLINDEERELIESEKTSGSKAGRLLDIIATKGPGAYDIFYEALNAVEYEHLADALEQAKVGHVLKKRRPSQNEVQAILIEGGVPPRPNVFVKRPKTISEIRNALYKLKDDHGWVVIHGMAGSGKTVLAAEAVRDAQVVSEYFPGGVFWASIGSIDQQQLLIKMQNLYSQLDSETHGSNLPRNIEDAKNRLRTLFLHRYPRALLILDDIWSQSVIKAFDIQCRILVTTRDATVMDRVMGKKTNVALSKGLSEQQSLEVFSRWTDTPIPNLPSQAVKIYEETKGSPMAINMIGAQVYEYPDRWDYYLEKLQNRKVSRIRKESAYEYSTLAEAVSIGITNLDEESKEFYYDFAIFVDDVKIPTAVFCTLWDDRKEFVEETMDRFVRKSLAMKEWNKTHETFFYSVHDLQLDYLKEDAKRRLPKLHEKLIDSYESLCNGKFHKLPNDGYIFWFIGHHMYRAGKYDLMAKVFLDLRFVESKLRVTGPADLISDLIKYSTAIVGENKEKDHKLFLHFLSSNAHKFTDKSLDIIQLALCQPSDSKIYQQARQMAKERCGKDVKYFDWCNRDTSIPVTFLTSKLHSGPVYSAEFSSDGKKIVSCSDDQTVKIFDSISGQELLNLDAHEERIGRVHYSPDSSKLVTCSHDKTLKIWSVPESLQSATGERSPSNPSPSIRKATFVPAFVNQALSKQEISEKLAENTFDTNSEVMCCQFSHSGRYLAGGCVDGSVYVWDLEEIDMGLLHQFQCHENAIRECAFTMDDEYLATCSQDGSVAFWSVADGQQGYIARGSGDMVESCSFLPRSSKLAFCTGNHIFYCDYKTRECEKKYSIKPNSMLLCIAHSPDGNYIAAGDSSYTVRVWDTHTVKLVGELRGHTGWIHYVSFSPDSKQLVSASDDEIIIVWDVETIKKDSSIGFKRDFDVSYKEDSMLIIAPDVTNRFRIILGETAEIIYQSEPGPSRIRGTSIAHDWSKVAYGCDDGTVKVIHLEGKKFKSEETLAGHDDAVRYCRYTEDGAILVTASDDKTLKIWTCDGACQVCSGHLEPVKKCMFFDCDRKVLSSSYDGTLRVWDVATSECLMVCNAHGEDWVLSCDISADETKFVSCSVDRTLKVFDAKTGANSFTLKGHRDCIRSCRFAKDGLLASGDDEGYIRLWDLEKDGDKKLRTLVKHDAWVTDIKFSDDSQNLVSVSENVKWWNCEGKVLQTLHIRGSFLKRIWASDDFRTFVTIDSAGTLYILREI